MKRNIRFTHAMIGMQVAAGCCLLQGCAYKKPAEAVPVVPETPVVEEAKPIEEIVPVKPVELKEVAPLTTPYTVAKGDTLSMIAAQYGLRWQDVAGVNPGIKADALRVGQVIQLPGQVDLAKKKAVKKAAPKVVIPAGPVVTYKVQKNDSLSVIAHKFGTKVAVIKAANGLTSDRIREGQSLKVPGATKKPSAEPVKQPEVAPVAEPVPAPAPEVAPAPAVDPAAPAPDATGLTPAPAPVPAPAVGVTPAPAAAQTYVVKEGEDLYAVAIRWGVSPSELKTLNNLTTHELQPGQTLKIPPVTPAP
jgi:LysM repeat protein